MNKVTTVAASAAAAFVLPIFFHSGVAAADDYAGQTYSAATEAAKKAKQTLTIAARTGDSQSQDDCLVTRSQAAPFSDISGVHATDKVLVYLDCNASYATATKPGLSLGSPEGRAAKAAADAKAAKDQAAQEAAAGG